MIDGVPIGLAVLCAAYFVVIMVHTSVGTSFVFMQLFFVALLLLLVYGKWCYARNLDRIPGWVPVSTITTCVAGVAVLTMLCVLVFLDAATSAKSNLDYVIVLGARVKERTVSSSLQKHLDKTMKYAEDDPDTILVLSGGKGPRESTSEAGVMYQYLVYNGVGPEQLLVESHSGSTMENIAYSKVVIEQHRKKGQKVLASLRQKITSVPYVVTPGRPLEIGVLTNNFRIYRARMTAEEWGFDDIYGISADSNPVLFIHLCVEECASIVKDRLMGGMRSIATGLRLLPFMTVSHNKWYKSKQSRQTIR